MSESISWHLRLHGPKSVAELCLRFGIDRHPDPEFPDDEILAFFNAVDDDLRLVLPMADGRLTHVLHVFDAMVLTQRMTAETAKRRDLWAGPSLQPLLDLVREAPLALADGGRLELSQGYGNVILGPPGWLPDAAPGELLAFRLDNGVVSAFNAGSDLTVDHADLRRARGILASHTSYDGPGDPRRHIDVTQTLAVARLEAPDLLSTPSLPLQELLYEPVDDRTPDMWRDLMAWRQDNNVSFSLEGVPEALYIELNHRAGRYGMSLDQFIIAVLGHLAWRTPFAEDMGPWESWDPERAPRPTSLQVVELPDGA
jgi:hypothetical protein